VEDLPAVRAELAAAGVGLEVLAGGELDVAWLWELAPAELQRFTIAQTGRYLLVETPYRGWPRSLELMVPFLRGRGITPVLAHPERNPEVQDRVQRVAALVEQGALVQVTAASLDGRLGAAPERAARRLLEEGLVHVLASDAHGPHIRSAGLAAAAAALGDEPLARYLTEDVPAAIVAGEDVAG
jgi:protein-tyrosine phosphatase